jgi:cell division protein FtsI/penicillin-binding protein 2
MNLELGAKKSLNYLNAFGFGNPTDLNFPGETSGRLPSIKRVKPYHLVTMSYGYALTSSLMQLTMAYASLGNDGQLMKPLLVKEILNSDGEVIERFESEVIEEVVRPKIAKQTIDIMKTVVENEGTGKLARVPGYVVAGKTGTAEKAIAGGYSKTDTYCTFIGLLPADDPKIAIGITIDTPTIGLAYGGVAAGPPFSKIAGETMVILGIPPDLSLLKDNNEEKKLEPDLPPPPPEIIWTEKGEIIMPNLQGLTLRDFLSTLQISNLKINFEGSGRVIEQHPRAGELLTRTDEITVKLR